MSDLYNQIPPERRNAYLANAGQAFEDVVGPLSEAATRELGRQVVADAQRFTRDHAKAIDAVHSDADQLARASETGAEAGETSRTRSVPLRGNARYNMIYKGVDLTADLRTELARAMDKVDGIQRPDDLPGSSFAQMMEIIKDQDLPPELR